MIRIATFLLLFAMMFGPVANAVAQDAPAPASDEQLAKEKAAAEKKALALLEQVVAEAPSLKLPENRIRLQIAAADLLWKRDQARARTLFSQATDGVAEVVRNADNRDRNQRPTPDQMRTAPQLRQDLVMTIARYDAPLAYQALAATRSLAPPAENTLGLVASRDDNLEQMLLSRIAVLDPKLALQNAEQFLDKGEYPRTLSGVLSQLQQKDKEAAAKLESKMVQRLQSANMLASLDAGNLAVGLLTPGPRLATTSTDTATTSAAATQPRGPVGLLSESNYQDVMRTLIEAALRATPAPSGQRGGNAGGRGRVPNTLRSDLRAANVQNTPSDAEVEQNNARRLLAQVQALLPKIDLYLPDRAQAVRAKASEVGQSRPQGFDMTQVQTAMQRGDASSLEALASSAPAPLQNRIYQQAAMKALDEGNVDRARSIADDHLEPNTRAVVTQAISFRQMADKVEAGNLENLRQTISSLGSESQKIDLLLQLAAAAQKKNPKITRELLDEAQRLIIRPATNYQQMDSQIKVARAFAALDPARSFQVLEPGIMQLNELLAAAATLSGFEVNVFRDGELPLQAGSGLGNMVNRYVQELALLAKSDFERAQTLVGRFQLAEARIQARMAIAQGILRPQPVGVASGVVEFRNFGQNGPMVRPPR